MRKRCSWHSDCDGRHCHPQKSGALVKLRFGELGFLLNYNSSHKGEVILRLFDAEHYYDFRLFSLHFCLNCGAFMGFGSGFGVCWRCEYDLEDE